MNLSSYSEQPMDLLVYYHIQGIVWITFYIFLSLFMLFHVFDMVITKDYISVIGVSILVSYFVYNYYIVTAMLILIFNMVHRLT